MFARRSLRPLELISFYNGTRPNAEEVDQRSWDLNSNAITVVDEESTCIDVPAPFDVCSSYCASLSHKANHCFDWNRVNAIFELYWHPRFGKLKATRALRKIEPGEEIYVDYGYELKVEEENPTLDGPDWWIQCLATDMPIHGQKGRAKSAEELAKREEDKDIVRGRYVCHSVTQIPRMVLPQQLLREFEEQGLAYTPLLATE